MAEDLAEMCRRLHLSDTERSNLRLRTGKIQQSKHEAKYSLLFRLLTTRPFNGEAFKATVRNLWASPGGITVRDIEDNLFLAVFNRRDDLERVIVQSPWTFDKKLIQTIRFEADMQPTAVKFTHSMFWIRVYNLPILSMVHEVGEDIGNNIGRLVEVDVPENGIGWGRFLRIRVELDVTKPLLRGKILEGDDGKPFWVDFRYEHLPIFCYRCGRIGHSGNECVEGRRSGDGEQLVATDRFGSWLRAVPVRGDRAFRRPRESVQSDDDREGHQSQGEVEGGNSGLPVEETIGRATENVEVVVEEDSVLPRITDPLARQDRGDELEDTGNSGVLGDMDINVENNEFFENSEHNDEDVINGKGVQIPHLVLTSEEKVEIIVDQVGTKPFDQATKGGGG
ncbi:hypothetical protein FCV25MIE_14812 [Fagus crenata]